MNVLESLKKLNTPIVIVGLGKSGRSAENLLLKIGFLKKDVLTFDEKSEADLKSWNDFESLKKGTLVVSPGVPLMSENIGILKNLGWFVTSEINLASHILTSEIVIGITGSVGKSTVTSILGAGAINEDLNAFVGGNLGTAFCDYAISILDHKQKAKFVILELSSYQLENCNDLKLDYSAITYLSANHLERYSSLDEYYLIKCRIGKMTKNTCVLNSASVDLMSYQSKISVDTLITRIENQKIQLIGKHNLENYFVALAIAKKCGWSEKSIQAMQNFSGLAHRLETVGTFNQVLYINDSKATAMDSVLVAVQAALEKTTAKNHLYLFLGGKDKNLPWQDLHVLSEFKNIKFYFFGQCAGIAKLKSNLPGHIYPKMSDALNEIFKQTKSGDVVLLSPGGTSLDEFKNFEDRGNQFKDIIHKNYSVK
jgi:UDP-N-acetylmuramoylalanine--D-glutamate ligase